MAKHDDDKDHGHPLQLGLVHMQQAMIASGDRAIVVLEGRDTAGKDGTIKAITKHLSVRGTRVIALPKPTEHEQGQWYFQRYVAQLPAAGEIVIFNRSWYNRAGVEVVNKFSTTAQQAQFLKDVPGFEAMLVESGIKLIKLWLDIDKAEQKTRLEARWSNPLKALKCSPLDQVAQKKWKDYTKARDAMLERTHTPLAPWMCVRSGDKDAAHKAVIRHLLREVAPADVSKDIKAPDHDILFPFELAALEDGRLAD